MLTILTGRAGSGKTTKMMNEIVSRLNDPKDTKNLVLFVPEQMSFQSEYEIAKKVKGKTYSRLQVFSFKRLAYRIFLEVGGLNKTFINDMAVEMMITKIIEEHKNKLLLYNQLSGNYSFVQLLHDVLKEFKSYQFTPELIENLIKNENMDETLKKKLHDIAFIYKELNTLYGAQLIDNEDFYQELQEKISQSNYLKNADIYIDGYHNFTTVELNAILQMIKTSHNVTMLFTLENPENEDMSFSDHLFHLPYHTFMNVKNFANDNKIKIKIEHLPNAPMKRFKYEELAFLEANYEKNNTYSKEVKALQILETENPTSEVHAVARKIYNDVLKNKTAYSDYVIYMNNQEVYYPLIHNIFSLYDIPVFIDDKKLMLDHFLLNFIDAALETIKSNFRYEAIFRAIKTEIFIPFIYNDETLNEMNYSKVIGDYRNRLDLLENYCLAHGIMGNDWEKPIWEIDNQKKLTRINRDDKDKVSQLKKIINDTKEEISGVMLTFRDQFKKASIVKEQVEAIYTLLKDLEIEKKLDLYEKVNTKQCQNYIDLNDAKRHKQVYNQLMDLFDELVFVCGDYKVSTDAFIKILRTGFKSMKFAIVPPAIDQVMVGSLKRSRFEMMGHFDDPKSIGVKKAFVLGVNENEIPKVQNEVGLITNKEREFLLSQDIELMPTIETAFMEEYFIIYSVLSSASDELVLSYTLSTQDKKEAYKSEIIERINNLFPLLKVQTIVDYPQGESDDKDYITSKNMTTTVLLQAINRLRKGYEVSDTWKALYGYFKHSKLLSPKLLGVSALNEAKKLDQETIKQVYGEIITASVSSVEKFNNCPYAYFLDKGLQLRGRDIQKVESMDIGDLYHETMKEVALLLIKQNKSLHELEFTEISSFVNQIVDEFSLKMQRKYFVTNKKNQYMLYKIKQNLIKSLQAMYYQSSHSQFKVVAVEEKFSFDANKLKVAPTMLSNGSEMRLNGYIDRIDVANYEDKPYVRIIDYKSGSLDIDFNKIYYRLSLQLFTYLDVVLNNAKVLFNREAYPAGVLYYHIQNPEILALSEITEAEILLKQNAEYKMNGYTLSDKMVSSLFDTTLNDSCKSDIVKVTFSKTGYHKLQSKVLNTNEMNALRNYTRKSITDSMEEVTSGKIDINPVLYRKKAPCQYCEFHSICKFDPNLRENQYREISKVGDSLEIIEKIVNEFGSESNE